MSYNQATQLLRTADILLHGLSFFYLIKDQASVPTRVVCRLSNDTPLELTKAQVESLVSDLNKALLPIVVAHTAPLINQAQVLIREEQSKLPATEKEG